jgi:flagellar hook-length control protein FliK
VFAKILAGLLRKTGAESALGGQAVNPLAEMVEGDVLPETETGAPGRKKSAQIGKTAENTPGKAGKIAAGKNGSSAEDEIPKIDFSEDNQNTLLGVELLLNRSSEKIAADGEGTELAGEIRPGLGALETDAAADAGVLFPGLANGPAADSVETAALAAEAADSLTAHTAAEKAETGREKSAKGEFNLTGEDPANTARLAEGRPEQVNIRKGEKEGRLEEVRSREKRRGVSLEVRDLRTMNGQAGLKNGETQFRANAETRIPGGSGTREITLELHLPNQGQDTSSARAGADTAWEVKSGQAFDDLLARELHQNFNGDIVRHASMMLRDGNEGTIKLALKPETLGNVKIRLEMAENKITGHIVVESEEALRAFEREIHSLEQAFKDSGFQSANLEMSLASDLWSGDGRGAEQNWQEPEASPFLSGRIAASRYDDALERAEAPFFAVDFYQRGTASINVLA